MPKMPLLGGGEVFATNRESAAFSPDNRVFVGVVVGECSCFLLAMFSESLGVGVGVGVGGVVGVGLTVGLTVGLVVGLAVGLAVGVSVGVSVGLRMGLVVG
jgi:hypothetical protein